MKDDKSIKKRYKAFLVLQGEDKVFSVYILRFPNQEDAEVVMRLEDETLSEDAMSCLEEGRPVLVKIDVSGGSMDIYKGTLYYRLGLQVHLQNIRFKETLQRRADVKVPMEEPGKITRRAEGKPDEVIPVTFMDISAGGIGFQIDEPRDDVAVGDVFEIYFDKGKTKINLELELCRVIETKAGGINCGGRFCNLGKWQEAEIRKFVFEIERREILRQRQIQEILEQLEAMQLSDDSEDTDDSEKSKKSNKPSKPNKSGKRI